MTCLEDRVPPLVIAWFSHLWVPHKDRTSEELIHFAESFEKIICNHAAKKIEYLHDASLVCADARIRASEIVLAGAILPSVDSRSPKTTCPNKAAFLVGNGIFNRSALSLYAYSMALQHTSVMPTEEIVMQPAVTLSSIINAFSKECKFKRWNDLYLHVLIKQTLPAWKSTTFFVDEPPWAVFSATFSDTANTLASPILNLSATELLAQCTPFQVFAIAGCLALELTNCEFPIVINTDVLRVGKHPTLAMVTDLCLGPSEIVDAYGYMWENVFYYTKGDPYAAIFAWIERCGSLQVDPVFVDLAGCSDAGPVSPHNPFHKFL
jgi:hypothetical protein